MSTRFNEHMRSHFRDCRLIHEGFDPNRQREARYFALPGEFDLIGYSDGTDSFMIPAKNNPFLATQIHRALASILAGEDFHYEPPTPRRRRIFGDDSTPTGRSKAIIEEERRVAAVVTLQQDINTLRRRRSFNG